MSSAPSGFGDTASYRAFLAGFIPDDMKDPRSRWLAIEGSIFSAGRMGGELPRVPELVTLGLDVLLPASSPARAAARSWAPWPSLTLKRSG